MLSVLTDLRGCSGFEPVLPAREFQIPEVHERAADHPAAPPGNSRRRRSRRRRPRHGLAALVLGTGIAATPATLLAQQPDHPGYATYEKWCAGCHGSDGRGEGDAAAYMLPRPRDFTKALYQVRTTASGELPTDADILHVIDEGMPGTAMPGWRTVLSQAERNNLVEYLKTFSRFFGRGDPPQALAFGNAPGGSEEAIAQGREIYQRIECWKCHGQEGRGDGQSAPTQTNDEGFPIRPADLTEPWLFNGGGTVEDIFRRLRTGLDGTPMPSFGENVLSDEELWNLAHYVRSLAPPQATPRVREVVRAAAMEGPLPAGPADSAWESVESFYIPLVGQIIVPPRWFAPTVDGVWVQAVHDGSELALRLTWSDPSRSPDPIWNEWRTLVAGSMEPKEGADASGTSPAATAGPAADPAAPAPVQPLVDAIAVQFPRTIPTGMERPYFLLGDTRDPVYLWHWSSGTDGISERVARGHARIEPMEGESAVTGEGVWEHGQWRVVLRRPLAVGDTADAAQSDRLRFATRQPIPMALFAWDGDNGESGTRGAISTWYFVYLDEATPKTVYATPVVAILLTAGLGIFVVGRAQRRYNGAGAHRRQEQQDA
jgi:DMSO reductase family type II enzyme heme b subunit